MRTPAVLALFDGKNWMVTAAYLHALGVSIYLGGALVMELVLVPAQKAIPPAQAQVMGQKAADRYLILAWSALGLIVASGVMRLYSMGNEHFLKGERLFDTMYGRTLFTMMMLWLVLVANGAIMTFVLRPRLAGKMKAQVSAAQVQARQQQMMRAAEHLTLITRIDLAIAFLVALLGASLRFGGLY